MPHPLDEAGYVTRLDPSGMLALTDGFPDQCARALEIARAAEIPTLANRPALVMLTGLGGSAAGGDFARAVFEEHGSLPFIVNRDYHVPNFLGLGDLVFCASYSGNTEETLSAYEESRKMGAKVIAITSGGTLAELAEKNGDTVIRIPGGQPPRTAMGYMLIPVLVACEKLNLIPGQNYEKVIAALREGVGKWGASAPLESNPAKQVAAGLEGKVPVLYGLGPHPAIVAGRWKGQINENAKIHAFAHGFPELNHNEILGWVGVQSDRSEAYGLVILEDKEPSAKMAARADITERLIGDAAKVQRVRAEGESLLERMLTLAFMGDYVSLYIAALRGVDPENIDWLHTLKAELAKVP